MSQIQEKEVDRKYIFMAIIVTCVLMSVPLVYANVSVFEKYFQEPNIDLELDNEGKVIIPESVGSLNKQYDHEEFAKLQQIEIEKAEKIRDNLIFSAINEGVSFYEKVYEVLYRHDSKERARIG